MKFDDIILGIAIVVIVLLVSFAMTRGVSTQLVDNACKELGYTSGTTTILFNKFCIRRMDQTDKVVPFKDAVKQQ